MHATIKTLQNSLAQIQEGYDLRFKELAETNRVLENRVTITETKLKKYKSKLKVAFGGGNGLLPLNINSVESKDHQNSNI